jgi:VWFA-related protein
MRARSGAHWWSKSLAPAEHIDAVMHSRFVIFATLLLCAIAASAQVREQITVEEVDVPVYVFSHGKPVRNLTKGDFELYVNGKRQAIDYFEAVDFAEAPPAAASPEKTASPESTPLAPHAELRERRLFVLLFDLIFKTPNLGAYAQRIDRSRRAAIEMVGHALPTDFFAVAAVTGHGIRFVTPFLRDEDAIRRAILQLAPSKARDGLALSITPTERGMAERWSGSPGDLTSGGRLGAEGSLSDVLASSRALEADRQLNLERDQIEQYGEVAARLRGLEGLKHVILFSDGYHSSPLSSVKEMAAAFQSANVYLHAVDLTPMAVGADPKGMSAASRAPQMRPSENPSLLGNPYVDWFAPKPSIFGPSENESLFMMSNETGGTWIHWTNQIAPALGELSTAYSAVYRLGFKPAAARKGHNDIDVKLKNAPSGTRLAFRKGFSTTVPSKADTPDPFLLADIIQNDIPQSGTPPKVSVVGRSIEVLVPVVQLSRQFEPVKGAQVMLYVFDSKGVPVVSRQKTFTIQQRASVDSVFRQTLDLTPGSYVAKVLLRVGDSLAFVKKPFEIAGM